MSRSRRWTFLGIVVLSGLVVVWMLPVLDSESRKGVGYVGVVVLEAFTVVPLIVLVARARRRGWFRQRPAARRTYEAGRLQGLREVDETLWGLARLVLLVPEGPAEQVARDALATAERASETRRRALARRAELAELVQATQSDATGRHLRVALADCDDDLARFNTQLDELGAALARLVGVADDGGLDADLDHVRSVTERVAALATGIQETNEL